MIVGLVFVLGVTVGRRVEARGHVERARTTAAEDPLAALDRLESNGGLTFKGALAGAQPAPKTDAVEQKVVAIEKAKAEAPAPAKKVEKKPEPPEKKAEPEKKPEPEKKAEAADKKPEPEKKAADPEKKTAEADKKTAEPADKKPEPQASKFTLQLSSFQDKHEADTFLGSIKSAGFAAYITEAEVSGKTFYRVRLGTYRSLEAANDAKAEVEKALKKSASVMKL